MTEKPSPYYNSSVSIARVWRSLVSRLVWDQEISQVRILSPGLVQVAWPPFWGLCGFSFLEKVGFWYNSDTKGCHTEGKNLSEKEELSHETIPAHPAGPGFLPVRLRPGGPAPQSEAPAAVTTETAPAEESGQTAAAASAGNIRGNGDLQQDGALRYSIGYTDPSEGEQKFRVLVLDCDTGKQTSLYTLEEPAQTVSKPFVVNGTVYVFTDKTMYQIPAAGGEARKVDLSAFFYPTSMDDTAGYSFSYDDSVNNFRCTRLDLQTGELSQVNLPAQTQEVWALNEPRIFLCHLVTEAPLPSVEEEEIYAAAMQNAISEYGWYDLTTGDFQKVAEEPYYGAEQSDGTKRRREFKGLAGGRLYFVWRMVDEESVTRSAALNPAPWTAPTGSPRPICPRAAMRCGRWNRTTPCAGSWAKTTAFGCMMWRTARPIPIVRSARRTAGSTP